MADFRRALSQALLGANFGSALQDHWDRKEREERDRKADRRYAMDDYDRTGRWDEESLGKVENEDEQVDDPRTSRRALGQLERGINMAQSLAASMGAGGAPVDLSGVGKVGKWRDGPTPGMRYDYTKSKEYQDLMEQTRDRERGAGSAFAFAAAARRLRPEVDFREAHGHAKAGTGDAFLRESRDEAERTRTAAEHEARYQSAVEGGVFRIPQNRGVQAAASTSPDVLEDAIRAYQQEMDPDTALARQNTRSLMAERGRDRGDGEPTPAAQKAQTLLAQAIRRHPGDLSAAVMEAKRMSGPQVAVRTTGFGRPTQEDPEVSAEIDKIANELTLTGARSMATAAGRISAQPPEAGKSQEEVYRDNAIAAIMADDSIDEAERDKRLREVESRFRQRQLGMQ